tara:strand:+ start:67859 stop:68947 length:1089 start_codon:yes stop_codon:yes gene_type:complete
MSLKCGIVGLPNVGKSTLFNALTSAGIDAENFPFCTIEPNKGIVPVPDKRLEKISEIVKPDSRIPTTTEFVDIAGLVKGASEGEGLGNKFLAHIRETQAIIQVVRCFDNDQITHVHNKIDPIQDIEIIETELILADLETLLKLKDRLEKASRTGDKDVLYQLEITNLLISDLEKGISAKDSKIFKEKKKFLEELQLISAKPCLYVGNVEDLDKDNNLVKEFINYLQERSLRSIVLCNQLEAEIAELEKDEGLEFLNELGIEEPGLNKLIRESFKILSLQTFFTAGKKEARAWTIKQGDLAPQAAGVIHSDFEKGFIRAETISYDDYIKYNGEQGAKEAGKLRSEGSDYKVEDGDIIHFRFNV